MNDLNSSSTHPGHSILFSEMSQDGQELTSRALRRRRNLIHTLSLIMTLSAAVSLLLPLSQIIASGNMKSIAFASLIFLCSLFFLASYYLTRRETSLGRLDLAAYLIVGSAVVGATLACLLQADDGPLTAYFPLIPVLAVITGLRARGTIVSAVGAGAMLALSFGLARFVFNPNAGTGSSTILTLINWLIVHSLISIGVIVFTRRLEGSTRLAEEQADRLSQVLGALKSTNEVGASLSHELRGVSNELNISSRQQASSTQEQVAAVNQVTVSLEELSETANQIAGAASSAATAAVQAVAMATEVKQNREKAAGAALEGNDAVSQAVESVSQVRNRIELLGQRFLNLTEQNRRVASIIDLIDEIADETHLLALNASIEAAGSNIFSGGDSDNMDTSLLRYASSRGERFGVIAQEIKGLADRSRRSTEEVRQSIGEMQGAVAAAVLVAEEGKKATTEALARSQIAGAVIDKLNELIQSGASQFDQILSMSEEVRQRCDEISVATGQQRSANQQIVATMRAVAQTAHESAGTVSELSNKAARVNQQVEQLNGLLAKSNRAVGQGQGGSNPPPPSLGPKKPPSNAPALVG